MWQRIIVVAILILVACVIIWGACWISGEDR